jgi:hypothetical protein
VCSTAIGSRTKCLARCTHQNALLAELTAGKSIVLFPPDQALASALHKFFFQTGAINALVRYSANKYRGVPQPPTVSPGSRSHSRPLHSSKDERLRSRFQRSSATAKKGRASCGSPV